MKMNKTLLFCITILVYLFLAPSFILAQGIEEKKIEKSENVQKEIQELPSGSVEDVSNHSGEESFPLEENTSPKNDDSMLAEDDIQATATEEEIDEATLKTLKEIDNKSTKDGPFKRLEKDVVLFMQGYGEASFKWTVGFEFFKGHTALIMQSPIFVQEANLSLLLLMHRRWYFGINYRDKTLNSEIYAGYIDIESDVKKHIRVGNKGINFPAIYPFIRGGSSSHLSPGASFQFEGERWRTDAIVRYDSEKRCKRVFYGKNERIENRSGIATWQKAKFFYLPHSNLFAKKAIVYVKDEERAQWRLLSEREYSIDSRKNMLILQKSFPYGVAINLFESNLVDESILNAKTYFSSTVIEKKIEDDVYININGERFLMLKKQKCFSAFEIASIYEVGAFNEDMEAYIVERQTENKIHDFTLELERVSSVFEYAKDGMWAKVVHKDYGADYKNISSRYPFIDVDSKIYDVETKEDAEYSIELLSYSYTPIKDYVLSKDANGDSIEVHKNGMPILNFEYDEQNHIVRLKQDVSTADKIEIYYSENLQYSSQGNVRLGFGVKYNVFEWMDVFFATMSNIAISKDKKEIHDKYNFSLGSNFKWQDLEAGTHFGFELDSNRRGENQYISKNHFFTKYESEKSYSIFKKPKLEADLDVNKSDSVYLHSNLFSALNIWKFEVDSKVSLQDTSHNAHVVEGAGHGLKAPLWFFYMDESFFINRNKKSLSRSNMVKLKKYIDVEHSGFVGYEGKTTQQSLSSHLSPIIPSSQAGNFFLQLKLNMKQKYRQNQYITEKNYFHLWAQSLKDLYSLGVASPINRSEELSFIFNWSIPREMDYSSGFSFQGLNFRSKLKADNSFQASKQDLTEISLRLPLSYSIVFITPFWERGASKSFTKKDSVSYKSDFESMFRSLKEQYWLFSTPVFYDLFDRRLPSRLQAKDGVAYYAFSNLYGLNLSRILFESYRDLYIPIEFEVGFSRLLKRGISFLKDVYKTQFSLKYAAQDVFSNRYGKGILSEINGDELSRNYDLSLFFSKDQSKNQAFDFNFKTLHKLYFYKTEDIKTGFENKSEVEGERIESKIKAKTWSETFSFLYSYRGARSLIYSLFERFSNFSLFDIREEKFSFSVGRKNYSTLLSYSVEYSHTQKTKIGEYGEMSIFAVFSVNSTNRDSILLNCTIGIAGKVEY